MQYLWDTDKKKWEDAIAKDNLPWTHVSDLTGWQSPAAKTYGVNAIPSNVLINDKGMIIAKNLRGDQLDQKSEKF